MEKLFPLFAYLLGSIPFGLILANLFGDGKLRTSGSKNIGATNVLRTQGKLLGGLTFLLDFLKGYAACYFFHSENELISQAIILAPAMGHMFPIWLKFKGGKGVATYFGIICSLNFFASLATAAVWIAMFCITRISSLASLASVVSSLGIFVIARYSLYEDFKQQLCLLAILVITIIAKHHENIARLIKGIEPTTKNKK